MFGFRGAHVQMEPGFEISGFPEVTLTAEGHKCLGNLCRGLRDLALRVFNSF